MAAEEMCLGVEMCRDVWWPWILVWGLTAVALVAATGILVAHWRGRGVRPPQRHSPGITLYLHDDSVMHLYLQGGYKTALRQEVEERIHSTKDGTVLARIYGVEAGGRRAVDREVFRRYIETAESITVIRIIMDVLEDANAIVYADLIRQDVEQGRALNRALAVAYGEDAARMDSVRLSDLEVFISIRGRFREIAKTKETTTFSAPFGDLPAGTNKGPRARITCVTGWLRRTVPVGTFHARCLGRLQGWDPDTQELVIDPIAIFQ